MWKYFIFAFIYIRFFLFKFNIAAPSHTSTFETLYETMQFNNTVKPWHKAPRCIATLTEPFKRQIKSHLPFANIIRRFNVYGSVHRNYIPIYIRHDATLYSLFISGNCSVSGITSIHHQERIQLYLQHLVFVTPLLLSAAIVEELEQVWVCCGWRTPVPTLPRQRQIAVTVWQIPDAVDTIVCAPDDGWK
jgi:hypothetical protein